MAFDFNALISNPAFNYGVSLLGGSHERNPLLTAQSAFMKWQAGQREAQLAQAEMEKWHAAQQQAAAEAPYKALLTRSRAEEAQTKTQEMKARRAIINGILQRRGLPIGETPDQSPNPFASPTNPFNGIPTVNGNNQQIGSAPMPGSVLQEDGSSIASPPAQAYPVQPGMPTSMQQTNMSPAAAAQNGAAQPPVDLVNQNAFDYDMAFNGGKNIGSFYENASKPIVLPNGGVQLRDRPDGGVRFAPGSLESMKQVLEMEQGVKGQYGTVDVPLSNGQKAMLSPTEWRVFQQTSQLPPRYANSGAGAARSGNTPTGGVNPNNFGNLRPVGASTGFQQFATPEAGLAALDADLAAKGRRGINNLTTLLNVYAPPSDKNDTQAYIADVGKRIGLGPQDTLDLTNPAVRHVVASAIMLHEKGGIKGLSQAQPATSPLEQPQPQPQPVVGLTPAPIAPEQQAQDTTIATDFGKQYIDAQKSAGTAQNRLSRSKLLESYLSKVATGMQAPSTLAVQKIANAAGFKVPPSASYAEAASALSKQIALEMRDTAQGGGLPGQMSNYEDRLLQSMVPGIDKLPGSNRLLLRAYQRQQQFLIAKAKAMSEYRKANGTIDEGINDKFDQLYATQIAPAQEADQKELEQLLQSQSQSQSQAQPGNAQAQSHPIRDYLANTALGHLLGIAPEKLAPKTTPGQPKFLGFE